MFEILLILSLLAVIAGFFFVSEATMGVGIMALAGVIAIWARIAQASDHLKQTRAYWKKHGEWAETQDVDD